jgi:hypothetical protein
VKTRKDILDRKKINVYIWAKNGNRIRKKEGV